MANTTKDIDVQSSSGKVRTPDECPPPKADVEAQIQPEKSATTAAAAPTSPSTDEGDEAGLGDNLAVPRMSLPRLFWFFFYNFGLFAWGGPVAQIALIKERLVIQERWITMGRFQRVFSVYQILPGPKAAEICMFFGCLSRGRLGGIAAGLGFILPGFILMLVASYVYSLVGFENRYFNASFGALQPIVAAMVDCPFHSIVDWPGLMLTDPKILRATHKLADHSLVSHKTKTIDPFLVIIAICTGINGALRINMSVGLAP